MDIRNKASNVMKKTIILALALTLSTLGASAQKQITILHTNDTHSCIMPLNANLADTMMAGRAGYLRRAALVQQERKLDADLLLLDSGDFSQGSPYYTMFKGDVEVGLMNIMGYDAATIGNHEFDFGLENMARIFRLAEFPIVCANYDFTGTPVEGLVKPYITLKRKGLRIGIFGVSPKLKGLVDENKCKGVAYLDPVATADSIATVLREKEKCDLVICLSHLGWMLMPPDPDDQQLIARSHDIDVVLGGHSHTYLQQLQFVDNANGRLIADDQNGKNAIFVGKLTVNMSKK